MSFLADANGNPPDVPFEAQAEQPLGRGALGSIDHGELNPIDARRIATDLRGSGLVLDCGVPRVPFCDARDRKQHHPIGLLR